MPTADTAAREYTAAEITAYEAHLSAMAEHNIVCARPGVSTREKMDAAIATDRTFRRFCEVANLTIVRGVRSPDDIRKIESLKAEIDAMTEAVRSAWSMLVAVDSMEAIHNLPLDDRLADSVNASLTLLSDAVVILRATLRKADRV